MIEVLNEKGGRQDGWDVRMHLFYYTVLSITVIHLILWNDNHAQASMQTTLFTTNGTSFKPIYFPSPFFYPAIRDVTQAHLAHFIRDASSRRRNVRFLNATQYNNIVHALASRSGEFIQQGTIVLQNIANVITVPLFSESWKSFLEENNLEGQKTWVYLKDIEGSSHTGTIYALAFGVQTEDGQNFNWVMNQNFGFSRLPSLILDQIDHGFLRSFERVVEDISTDYTLTLYLKEFSLGGTPTAPDMTNINIGILVEDENGQYIDDLDWIIARDISRSYLIATTYLIQESVFTAPHEAAHLLIGRVLKNDVRDREYFSIVPQLLPRDRGNRGVFWSYTLGVALTDPNSPHLNPITRKEQIIHYMAAYLGGDVLEDMTIKNRFPDFYRDRSQIIDQFDEEQALSLAYRYICSGLSPQMENPNCSGYSHQRPLHLWVNDLPEAQRTPLVQEAQLWMEEARHLVRQILTRHVSTLRELLFIALRKGTLDAEDIQMFYADFPQIDLPLEEVKRTPIQSSLDVFDDMFWSHVFYRTQLLFSSLTPNQWSETVLSSPEELLRELDDITVPLSVPEEFLPYIRTDAVNANIQPLPEMPLFYFQLGVQTLENLYNMFR